MSESDVPEARPDATRPADATAPAAPTTRAERHRKRRWWRDNALALILLGPAIAAALFASSYRLTELYRPSLPTHQLPASGDSGTYTSSFRIANTTYERTIDVRLVSVTEVGVLHGKQAVDGAKQWAVSFAFTADPSVPADSCTIELYDEAGNVYHPRSALVDTPGAEPLFRVDDCLVPGEEGPMVNAFTGKLEESGAPRPPSWRSTIGFAMPDDVVPAKVRIYWDTPNYLDFDAHAD